MSTTETLTEFLEALVDATARLGGCRFSTEISASDASADCGFLSEYMMIVSWIFCRLTGSHCNSYTKRMQTQRPGYC